VKEGKPNVTTATENIQTQTIQKKNVSVGLLLLKLRTFVALIVLIVVFSVIAPNFLNPATVVLMARHASVYAFLAIGMTFVIITGGIDLSVGSTVGLAGMVAGGLILKGLPLPMFGVRIYFRVWVIVLITLALGMLVGAINGLLITRFNVPPFIGTLGTLYIARGVALLIHQGQTYPNLVGDPALRNTGFPKLGAGTFLHLPFTDQGIPYSIWLMILVAGVAAYLAAKTPRGRHIYAVGGNERAATLSGVRVNRVKIFVYMFSGFCSAIGGLIWASQLVASHPMTGETFELHAIAAAVLGGTSLAGGRGTIGGTIIGAFVIGILGDGMVMVGVSSFWQMVIKGLVIVTAVVVDQMQQKMQQKVALQQQQD
jgi:erythritol transport system permease protein